MIDKLEKKTVQDSEAETLVCKTPGLNNPKNYVLTGNRFHTYMVLSFSDINKTQISKMPYRDSPHHEIQILMSFISVNLFKPNERTEVYHIRKPNDKNFVFGIEPKKYVNVRENFVAFEKNDKIVEHFSKERFNVI